MENYIGYFKALRESKGLTLREVERQTEVSNAYLSQLESGKIKQPSPLTLHKLSEIYGVGYDILMEKVGYPPLKKKVAEINRDKSSIALRVGSITEDEEVELLNYLKFMRSRKK
ncbi:helix-turn-helix domain-containing protein [Pedobacter insulae]|uniref:Helix-turn-helix n=1 Tax=Pedobacter insulae TaxID=414048 RepID=A0A1I2ZGZ2_9SPHI|nr:helix-turn-helix transcriptional regulator [Pedobacter insulae]SFH37014.1 Helix-turn-helix [Pedobacter insulae]